MHEYRTMRPSRDSRGVLTVTLDVPDVPVNVINDAVVRDLGAVIDEAAADPSVKAIVFRSGKPSGFLAGADVKHIQRLRTPEELETVIRAGQDLFDRVESLKIPTVAVIHGPCLGGGLEFAMACSHRIARDDGSTKLGLPETQLGVVPGWGGTQRLPRLVGQAQALTMILQAKNLSAAKATKAGLIDRTAAPDGFDAEVDRFVSDVLEGKAKSRPQRGLVAFLRDGTWPGRKIVRDVARRRIAKQARHYPALESAIRAVEVGLSQGHEAGLRAEREEFGRLLFTPACRSLLGLFFQREKARKAETWSDAEPAKLGSAAVLGAGVMGAGIAQALANSGYRVVLKDINQELVDGGLKRIETLNREAARKGAMSAEEAEAKTRMVSGTVDWEPVAGVDLVIEAVVERMNVKQEVFGELDRRLRPEAIIASNTSALPVSEMASATGRPDRVAGLHFFNPVHRMPLVEVVRAPGTGDETIASLVNLVRKLGKVPVVVAEGPGFLVNRILFPYLDEAVRLALEGVPFEEIDREAKKFGMPMGPVELLDTVGIDVAADVGDTLLSFDTDESPTPAALKRMVESGRRGQKTGHGFYRYEKGRKTTPDASGLDVRAGPDLPEPVELGGETLSGIQQRLMFPMVNEAAKCLGEGVVREAWMVDLAMVLGTGFAPFRGGPLRAAELWGVEALVARMERLSETAGPRFAPAERLREMAGEAAAKADSVTA